MFKKQKRGISLVEILMVVAIIAVITTFRYIQIDNEMKDMLAKNLSLEIKELGQATNAYINLNYKKLSNLENDTGLTCTKQTQTCVLTTDALIKDKLLPDSYKPVNKFGSSYDIILKREGNAPNYMINGLITTTKPILNAKKKPDSVFLGKVILFGGPDYGYSTNKTTVSGYSGMWNETNTKYKNITDQGLLAYRVGYSANMYSIYLRRDGTLPMTGNLNLDDNDINNIKSTYTKNAHVKEQFASTGKSEFEGSLFTVDTDKTLFKKRVDMDNSLFIKGSELNATNADAKFKTVMASGNIESESTVKGKEVVSTGRTTVGEFLKLEKAINVGDVCTDVGLFSRDPAGELMTCINGKWDYIVYKEHFVRMGQDNLTVVSPGNYKYVLVTVSSKFWGRDGSHYRVAEFNINAGGSTIGTITNDQYVSKGGSRGHSWVYEGYAVSQKSFKRNIKRGEIVSVKLTRADYHFATDIRVEFVN